MSCSPVGHLLSWISRRSSKGRGWPALFEGSLQACTAIGRFGTQTRLWAWKCQPRGAGGFSSPVRPPSIPPGMASSPYESLSKVRPLSRFRFLKDLRSYKIIGLRLPTYSHPKTPKRRIGVYVRSREPRIEHVRCPGPAACEGTDFQDLPGRFIMVHGDKDYRSSSRGGVSTFRFGHRVAYGSEKKAIDGRNRQSD